MLGYFEGIPGHCHYPVVLLGERMKRLGVWMVGRLASLEMELVLELKALMVLGAVWVFFGLALVSLMALEVL